MRAKNNILEGVWILFPILIFASYLLYRLYDQSAVLFFFPLDYSNDLSSVMAQLYFLAEYGFHAIIPHWYNGSFQLFQFYYPGWFYFALPLYWLTSNVQYAWYMALILVYLLAFLSLIIFRKTFGLSRTEASLFFLVFFANPLSIGNFIRLGRTVEFFSWFLFLSLSLLLFYYRGRSFDRYILLFIPLFTLLLLSHPTVLILFGFVLLSFLLTKPMREKIVLILLGFVSFIFSSFWFVPYLLNISKGSILSTYHLNTDSLFFFSGGWLFLNLVWAVFALSFLLLFYSYWKQKRFSYHELLFFSPVLFIAFLFLSRLVFFIPGLQQIFPDTYTLFFLFFSLYLLFNIKVDFYPLFFRRFFPIFFTLLAVFSVVFSFYYTPLFSKHTQLEHDTLLLLEEVDGRFVMFTTVSKPTSYSKAYYSYAPIYLNLSTPGGWSPQSVPLSYREDLDSLSTYFRSGNYKSFYTLLEHFETHYFIAYDDKCEDASLFVFFELVGRRGQACLFYASF